GELRAWCNYYTNVPIWITDSAPVASTISLLRLSDNLIDLNSTFGVQAVAFDSGSNISFTSALLLNNISRRFGTANPGDIGFEIFGATNISAADNVAQVPAGSDARYSVGLIDDAPHGTFLGNRTPTLQILRGFNPATNRLAEELFTK